MKVNYGEIDAQFNKLKTDNTDEKISIIIAYLSENYGDLKIKDCISLLKKSKELNDLVKEYISSKNDLSKYEKEVKETNLKYLIEAYFYTNSDENEEVYANYEIDNNYNSMDVYMSSINEELLTKEEEIELMKRVRNGDKKARDKMILANTRLVKNIAKKITSAKGKNNILLDAIEEGNYGLIGAVDNFNPNYGVRFSTYAVPRIKQAILSFVQEREDISVSRYVNDNITKYKQIHAYLNQLLGRDATKKEIAHLLNVSLAELSNFEILLNESVSLNATVGDEDDSMLMDFIPDDNADAIDKRDNENYLHNELISIINTKLDPIDADIICSICLQGKSTSSLAKKYHLSPERIRQRIIKSFSKLRRLKQIQDLTIYITDRSVDEMANDIRNISAILKIKSDMYKASKNSCKKNNTNQFIMSHLFDKLTEVCNNLKNGKYTYEDILIDEKVLKKTI